MISAAEAEPAHHERPLRYLIARHEHNRLELFTLATSSERVALPVFGTERAARDFLLGGGFGSGWRVRESTTGELVSLLLGRPAVVDCVALDPRPGIAPDDAELRGRKGFVDVLMGEPFVNA